MELKTVLARTRPAKQYKRNHRPVRSTSSTSSSDDGKEDNQRESMLAALQAHGRAMFGFSGSEEAESSEQGARRSSRSSASDNEADESEKEYQSDDGWGAEDGFVSDSEDGLVTPSQVNAVATLTPVPEVVFAPAISSIPVVVSKAERRAFLNGSSTKMMGLRAEADYGLKSAKRSREEAETGGEDQTNMKLDKSLHDMLLTTLLPSAAADSASRPVDKRNAVSGRLLELASYSLPGEGSKSVSSSHLSKHPANIRTGLIHAKARRDEKAHAEAQAASGVRKGYDGKKKMQSESRKKLRAGVGEEVGKKKGMEKRKEERGRGLATGIGKFGGGMLRLSKEDIARGSGEEERRFRGKRGKGRR